MFEILVYVNLVFNVLFTLFLVVIFTGVLKKKNEQLKQINNNKKVEKQTQKYHR